MKNPARLFGFLALTLALVSPGFAAKPLSDLVSPERRRVTVELAQRLTRPPEPVPVPADLAHPFNPAGFDQPDPEELKAAQAAALAKGLVPQGPGGPGPAGPAAAPQQAGDREILEGLAMKLPNAGTMNVNGKPILVIGSSRVKIGDRFTVASNGQDYELELVAIDRTTFTLRYRSEEFTRPSRKSP
jgi:hypothetical protein